jgi:hypothetical protein
MLILNNKGKVVGSAKVLLRTAEEHGELKLLGAKGGRASHWELARRLVSRRAERIRVVVIPTRRLALTNFLHRIVGISSQAAEHAARDCFTVVVLFLAVVIVFCFLAARLLLRDFGNGAIVLHAGNRIDL